MTGTRVVLLSHPRPDGRGAGDALAGLARRRFDSEPGAARRPGAGSDDFYYVTSKPFIDGTVTNRVTGSPVKNVKISLKGAKLFTATTNGSGYFNALLKKGSYTVVPEGDKHDVFLPAKAHATLGL